MAVSTLQQRFTSKVNKRGPKQPHMRSVCWVWTGYVARNGYGQLGGPGGRKGKILYAHRVAYFLAAGLEPAVGLDVCHHCDCRNCVRPSHLFLGTRADNMQDALRKGRAPVGAQNGLHKHPERAHRRLSLSAVLTIRKERMAGVPLDALARRYGVSASNISRVALRKTWKYVEDAHAVSD